MMRVERYLLGNSQIWVKMPNILMSANQHFLYPLLFYYHVFSITLINTLNEHEIDVR